MTVHPPKQPEWKLFQFPQRFILKPTRPRRFDDPADLRRSLPSSFFFCAWWMMLSIYNEHENAEEVVYHVGFKYFWGIFGAKLGTQNVIMVGLCFLVSMRTVKKPWGFCILGVKLGSSCYQVYGSCSLSLSLSLIYIYIYTYIQLKL